MGLSTHVLDTMHGQPAQGMAVTLYALGSAAPTQLKALSLNADGRSESGPLLDNTQLKPGRYRLCFEVAAYFTSRGVVLPDPPFLDVVTLDFGIANTAQHYHVPLLVSPWSYSTYRGS